MTTEPFWHAVVSKRAPIIDKAIRRLDVAEEYADKARDNYPDATDIEVVALYRDAGPRAGDGNELDAETRSDTRLIAAWNALPESLRCHPGIKNLYQQIRRVAYAATPAGFIPTPVELLQSIADSSTDPSARGFASAMLAEASAVPMAPPGWRLVPIDPTEVMVAMGSDARDLREDDCDSANMATNTRATWAEMLRAAPLPPAAQAEPYDSRGPTTLDGWRSVALAGEKERDWLRERLQTVDRHQGKDCWYWQNDGEDHLESLTNALPVVIRADHLRELLNQSAAGLCDRICDAIHAADDKSMAEAGYMLDCNDCCRIVRDQFDATFQAPATVAPAEGSQK